MYGSAVANGTWPNAYAGGFTALSSGSVTDIDLEITSRFAAAQAIRVILPLVYTRIWLIPPLLLRANGKCRLYLPRSGGV